MTFEMLAHESAQTAAPPVDEVLSGVHGLGPVRRLVAIPTGASSASQGRGSSLPDRGHALLRTKFKPGRSLTAWYAATGPDGTSDCSSGQLCVTWSIGGVEVLRAPDDPLMPQLRELHDPTRRQELIGAISSRPLGRAGLGDLHTLRYRPRQRHVLMLERQAGTPGFVVKIDREDSGRRAVPLARSLVPLLRSQHPAVRPVEPLGYVSSLRAAVWIHAAGTPLSAWIRTCGVRAAGLLRLLGRATRGVHAAGPAVLSPAPTTTRPDKDVAAIELATVRRAGALLRVLVPKTWSAYDDVLATVEDGLSNLPARTSTLVHGDLKADNVLVDRGSLRILDLDRASWTDPAVDLGRLVADLTWWCDDVKQRGVLVAAFRAGYGAQDAQLWQRAALWATAFELRQAARRCAVHDPRWADDIARRVHDAAAALDLRGTR